MARLPIPGSDDGNWGSILNDFLEVAHATDGTLKNTGTLAAKADDTAVVHTSGSETVGGTKAFSSSPTVPVPTLGSQAANKTYVDSVVVAPADATTSTKGVVQLGGDLNGVGTTASAPVIASGAITTAKLATGAVTTNEIANGTITDTDISGTAGIAKSKLASLAIVDADVSAISESKVTNLTTDLAAKVDKSTATTKGDLLVATAASTVARLGVGTDGQVLQANSGQATGVQWVGVDNPDAATLGLGMITNSPAIANSSHTLSSGTALFVLTRNTKPQTISTLGVWISVAGGTSSGVNCMALYTEAGVLLSKTNTMSFTSAGYVEGTLTASQTLSVGTYYIGVLTHLTANLTIKCAEASVNFPVVNGHYLSVALTSQTDFPASFTPSSAGGNSSFYIMGGR